MSTGNGDATSTDTGSSTTPTTDSATTPPTTPPPATETPATGDLAAEVEKWKTLARKHEERAATNATAAKRLAEIEAANQTEQEKAVAAARTEGVTDATSTWRPKYVAALIESRTAGKVVDPQLVAALVNLDALKWDGDEVDRTSIDEEVTRVLKDKPYLAATTPGAPPAAPPPPGSGDQGSRKPTGTSVTREQLKNMTAREIAALPPDVVDKALAGPR